ncbi:MAG: Ca-activated chloride channel family protein [Gammaproteobacteria bacterium]|jgi:Ca-activated chloride channel family protein
MLQLAWPWVFLALPLPLLVVRFMRSAETSAGAIHLPYFSAVTNAQQSGRFDVRKISRFIYWFVWLLVMLSAARPQWVGDQVGIPSTGRNLMLAVDVSGSMKTRDLKLGGDFVTRLQVVRLLGQDFLERRVGDRIGLILFGSQAYLQAPLSFDRKTVATLLDEALIGIAGERTAIGDAIGLALKRLRLSEAEHRVVILLTDGANTAGSVEPMQAARMAAQEGLKIYTVGIGADRLRVESLFGSREVNPSADLDEKLLQQIAELSGGRYYRARNSADLQGIYNQIDQIEPAPQTDRNARRIEEYFYWPLSLAMIISLLALSICVWRIRPIPSHEPDLRPRA